MEKKNAEIVIIEDEEDILELLEYHLDKEGYDVTGFLSTENVEQFMEEESPSLLIVDRNLPGVEGSEFVAHMREIGYDIPVIFLTAKDKDEDLEEGFRRGGDDYITKPFKTKELLLRVEALLRRSGVKQSDKLRYRDLILDNKTRELLIDNQRVDLTNLEYKLLYTFVKNAHQTLERDFLRDQVWGDDNENFHDKTINVAINRLKKKIDPNGNKEYFIPVWGVGYKLG
ncbi:response regulator transcription factor [Sulfurovum sp. zt1-1]|uniref:Response regulator transcription factor n=1 Tax=Sulfurovum zhangzhouensis TaxID=3019067 RepID=A0ABT7QXH0_9BACT|nr:response regulator transcription factor [Sulfurovum zhangzhouensis]MDM5271533.1 response regulator transcription factor [Sulfurovum zhangzhouensis]